MSKTLTRRGALTELASLDHCFVTPEGTRAIAAAYGYDDPPVYSLTDTRSTHKGLTLHGCVEGDSADGCDAAALAEWLVAREGLELGREFNGRGRRLSHAVAVLRSALTSDDAELGRLAQRIAAD